MTARPPEALSLVIEEVPDDLAAPDHWVAWGWEYRSGKWTKVPINPASGARASSTDPSTWSGFEEAVRWWRAGSRRRKPHINSLGAGSHWVIEGL